MKTLNVCVLGFDFIIAHIYLFAETDDFEYDALKLYVAGSAINYHQAEGVLKYLNKEGISIVWDPDGDQFREAINAACPDDPDRGDLWEFVSETAE